MKSHASSERLNELLALRALEGLAPDSQSEFNDALADVSGLDLELYDRTAAAVHMGCVDVGSESLPESLRLRLENDASSFLGSSDVELRREASAPAPGLVSGPAPATGALSGEPSSAPEERRSMDAFVRSAGWLLAAASVLLWLRGPRVEEGSAPTAGGDLGAPVDALALFWSATEDELASGVSGDLLWSNAEQRGEMRFSGLRPNDPSVEQYQLWIFDSERAHPVDGGVFDVGLGGEVRVPIDAKLSVGHPVLFAVTLERPGGVVVSDKERLLLTAEVM